jgi:hypothetical protein
MKFFYLENFYVYGILSFGLDHCNMKFEKNHLNVTKEERIRIEEATRSQSKSSEWFALRARRITGSICGKILCQKERTDALLINSLYNKPMYVLPPPIKWGCENDSKACAEYVRHMRARGHEGLDTSPCGFIIHESMGWLGASPDAFVTDPSETLCHGIAEFKCPYSKRNEDPLLSCDDPNFYCYCQNDSIRLKHEHM